MFADLADSLHVNVDLNAELLGEEVDELDCRSSRTSAEPPYVGVEDVHAVDDRHNSRSQTVARSTVSVEVDGNFDICFELRDDRSGAQRINQTGHILESDDLRAESFHLTSFFNEVFVCEDLFGFCGFLAEETAEEADLFGFGLGIDGVAYSAVGDTAEFVDQTDRFLDIVNIVERVEDTHHVKTVFDSFLVETFENVVGVGNVAEEVTAARESREQRFALHCL